MLITNQQTPDTAAFFMAFQSMVKLAVKEALSEQVNTDPQPETLRPPATRREAAKFLNLSLPTLDTLIRTEQIKAYRIGRQVRINWEDLERYTLKGGR